jgi:tetraacyldisaccharide 4'-kinase
VLVSPDRYLAGVLAERRFGATVHLLDDGFQHLELERDVDLLLVGPADLTDGLLPTGRLREPLDAATAADAILVPGSAADAARVGAVLDCGPVFTLGQEFGAPRLVAPLGDPLPPPGWGAPPRLVAVAGIARPERFFASVEAQGWHVAQTMVFRDHHWYRPKDLAAIRDAVQSTGSAGVITTEKDAVRLTTLPLPPDTVWTYLPMRALIEPGPEFRDWFFSRLAAARTARGSREVVAR